MNAKLSILFYGKKSKKTKEGLVPIYMRVTINRKRIELSTQRYVDPAKWSSLAGKVKGTAEEARSVNNYLDVLKARVYDHQVEILRSGEEFCFDSLKNKLLGTEEKTRTLLPVFENTTSK